MAYDYQPIICSFGTVLVQVDQDDYQGDSYVLLQNADRYGFLVFGWGSCSGCDALQSCETFAGIDELISDLERDVKWFDSLAAAVTYIADHEQRRLSFYAHCEEWPDFVNQVVAFQQQSDHDHPSLTDTPYSILTAAIAAVLPEETERPDPRDTVRLVRQSERNRIKAKLLQYADSLPSTAAR